MSAAIQRQLEALRGQIAALEARLARGGASLPTSAVAAFERATGKPDAWQRDVLTTAAAEVLLLCCRQAGKSTTLAALALFEALTIPDSVILLVSPTFRQSGILFRKVLALYRQLGRPVTAVYANRRELELSNGSMIVSLPGNEETIRGYSGVTLVIIDEASRVPDALYYAIRPMLAVSGGRLLAATTPWGKRGWFYDAWEQPGMAWKRIKVTAYENPRITSAFLEREKQTMPDAWFRAEYLCEFTDTEDSVFTTEQIGAAAMPGIAPLVFN